MVQRSYIAIFFVFSLSLALTLPLISYSSSHAQMQCDVVINRSAVPDLNFDRLTLLITVNDATNIQLSSHSQAVPFTKVGSQIMVTTELGELNLEFDSGSNTNNLCKTTKAPLLNDRRWAWSHGFDDNVNLKAAIDEFRAKSWPATLFLIANVYDQTREESYIVDEPYVNRELIPAGWVLGNHSWSHEVFPLEPSIEDYRDDIRKAQTRLEDGISRSSNPDLKVISFASPNFSSWYELPFYQVAPTNDLMLLEVGNDIVFQVANNQDYHYADGSIPAFGTRTKIGRDPTIEISSSEVIENMDWMSQHSSDSVRFWYNTLSHGDNEANIKQVIDHVWDNYGPNGADEAWVTSSTEIYSYILTRDNSVITTTMNGDVLESGSSIYLPLILR